jgi:SNF2 family DNA or RNA helicase
MIEAPPLWTNQRAFIERCRIEPSVAAFMDPGTGKTRAMIEALREEYNAHKRICKTLIVCPLSTCRQWKNAFEKFSKIPEKQLVVLTGDGKRRTETLGRFGDAIAITNFEGLRIRSFYQTILNWSPEVVVIDESHRIKDSSSKTAGALYPLCITARRRFILTGTPILNSLLDIFGQYKALDPKLFGPSFWKFKQKYFYDRNAGMPPHLHWPDWHPVKGADRMISGVIARTAVHAKKSECLDLPPLVPVIVPVELSPEQRRVYTQMEKEFVAELGNVTATAEFAMTKSLRLQQILTGFVAPDATAKPAWVESNPRLQALKETIEGLEGRQVIIWTNFVPTYGKLEELIKGMGLTVSFLTGQQSASEKEQSKQDFISGKSRVLVSNPAAGGTGVDGLQCAQYAIYYARSYNAEHFYQSRDRNHRGGSEVHDKITHYHLMAEGTLDEVIYEALKNKQRIGEVMMEWARRQRAGIPV